MQSRDYKQIHNNAIAHALIEPWDQHRYLILCREGTMVIERSSGVFILIVCLLGADLLSCNCHQRWWTKTMEVLPHL